MRLLSALRNLIAPMPAQPSAWRQKSLPPELIPSAFGSPYGGAIGGGLWSADRLALASHFKRWNYVAINAKADALAGQRLRVGHLTKEGEIVGDSVNHPIQRLLDDPNEVDCHFTFLKMTEIYMELIGSCYWWMRNDKEIWYLPPHFVWPWYANGKLYRYRVYPTYGRPLELDPEDVIAMLAPNPLYPLDGQSPMFACDLWVDTSEQLDLSRYAVFLESVIPSIVLEVEKDGPYANAPPTDDYLERIKSKLRERFQGAQKVGEPALIPPGLKLRTFETKRDLHYTEGADQMRDMILACHRVPKTIVGLTDAVNRATAESAAMVFHNLTIKPKLQFYAETLTKWFRRRFRDPQLVLYFPDSEAPVDSELEMNRWEQHARLGAITVNEYRKAFKLEPLTEDYMMGSKPEAIGREIAETGEQVGANRVAEILKLGANGNGNSH